KIISYIGALAYLARAFADYLGAGVAVAAASILFFYAVHVIGVRWFGRVQVWMCILLGISLVVLIVPGLFAIHPANYRPLFTLGALMAITTSLNATMLVPSRVAIMLAEDGLLPKWLARISPRTGTPIIGLTITAAAALVLLLSGQISLALNIAVFALVVLY